VGAYSSASTDKLYSLLPAAVREKDITEGEPLRALLRIIEAQADDIEADIGQLGRDAFIETCEPWAIPYIGDLVGNIPIFDESHVHEDGTASELFPDLSGPSLAPTIALSARADVARTIHFRRRKGTVAMLEDLARAVTGWSAHVVPMFSLLGWTQWLRNHIRMEAVRTLDLRSVERAGRVYGPFDTAMHTVDVRQIGDVEGWYNISNLAFFLWRLIAFPMTRAVARAAGPPGDFRFYFSQLGQSAPLFSRVRAPADDTPLSSELSVPRPIRPARFFADLQAYANLPGPHHFTDFYGLFEAFQNFNASSSPSLMVYRNGQPIMAEDVRCANLSQWRQPLAAHISIDVELGRLALGPQLVPADSVEVFYHYGFPAELGGGPYPRRAWLVKPASTVRVLIVDASGASNTFSTIGDALGHWATDGRHASVIRIQDNRTYSETLALNVSGGAAVDNFLTIEAADGFRPHLLLNGPLTIDGNRPDFTLTLGGLLIEGAIEVQGSLGGLRLLHTTLVPGISIAEQDPPVPPPATPPHSLQVAATNAGGEPANTELIVALAFSITGPLRIPEHVRALYALDSIIDGIGDMAIAGPVGNSVGPAVQLERSTLRGSIHLREIVLATEVIFDGLVTADRIQVGCVRFSYVVPGSQVPRRYNCQPDLAEQEAVDSAIAGGTALTAAQITAIRGEVDRRVQPVYTDLRYGQPAYLQLSLAGPSEIARGAEDGSEMGVYCHLKQPQREANLRQRLAEYVPFGLESGLIYET
jgi:hypothetical protein